MMLPMQKYITLEKLVGETPLSCAEAYRAEHPELNGVPMAYAGRLDPMASGKLLILLGEECKHQEKYHGLDKEYEFSVLFGIESDSLDVLGRLETCSPFSQTDWSPVGALQGASPSLTQPGDQSIIKKTCDLLIGEIELPYPRFSSKTVQGKPLHTWTLEGRLDEIEIPTKHSTIYRLEHIKTETISRRNLVGQALEKVNSIPPVTDLRKAIGNDFRRVDVRTDWENIRTNTSLPDTYSILTFSCLASSGTYMRTLASVIAQKLNTCGLAWSIHRTKVGIYNKEKNIWTTEY